jgi:hypothetical protein
MTVFVHPICLSVYSTCDGNDVLAGSNISVGVPWIHFWIYCFKLISIGTTCSVFLLWSLGDTQRQALELISGPRLGAKTKVMSFNGTHSRAVIGLLTGHNTLRQHLYLLGLQDSPLCRKCVVMEETSAYVLCECEALVSLRHAYLGSFFLEPEGIQSISLGAIWSFSKASGLPWLDMGHRGPALRPRCLGAMRSWTLDILPHYSLLLI